VVRLTLASFFSLYCDQCLSIVVVRSVADHESSGTTGIGYTPHTSHLRIHAAVDSNQRIYTRLTHNSSLRPAGRDNAPPWEVLGVTGKSPCRAGGLRYRLLKNSRVRMRMRRGGELWDQCADGGYGQFATDGLETALVWHRLKLITMLRSLQKHNITTNALTPAEWHWSALCGPRLYITRSSPWILFDYLNTRYRPLMRITQLLKLLTYLIIWRVSAFLDQEIMWRLTSILSSSCTASLFHHNVNIFVL